MLCSSQKLVAQNCSSFSATINKQDISCNGSNDGVAYVEVSGGQEPFNYNWSEGMGKQPSTLALLKVGTYSCTITDAQGCQLVKSTTIAEPDSISINFTSIPAQCGGATGEITVIADGGYDDKKYYWSHNGETNSTISNLSAGEYTVIVSDNNGCVEFGTAEVADIDGTVIDSAIVTPVICTGSSIENGGSIELFVSGGNEPYEYIWRDIESANSSILSGLEPGNYSVKVTDASGCITFGNYFIENPSIFTVAVNVVNTLCNAAGGSAISIVTGGTSPFTYSWSLSNSNSSVISGLNSGSGQVTVTDANGCRSSADFEILDVNGPAVTISQQTEEYCFQQGNASVKVYLSGGTAPYIYELFQEGNYSPFLTTTNNPITRLLADKYKLTVIDNNGCKGNKLFEIVGPDMLEVDIDKKLPTSANSNDGIAFAHVIGGTPPYTYLWDNGSTFDNVSGIGLENNTLTVTDANGCNATAYSNPRQHIIDPDDPVKPVCPGPVTGTFIPVYGEYCEYTNTPPNCFNTFPIPNSGPVTMSITDFGADGTDDFSDQCAFEQAVDFFSSLGSGIIKTLIIPQGTYYIGRQDPGVNHPGISNFWLIGHNTLNFERVENLTIVGNVDNYNIPTSIIRINPCLRYGAFDPNTGERLIGDCYDPTLSVQNSGTLGPNNGNLLASVGDMFFLFYGRNITIRNLELDGNIDNIIIGGGYTEGMQIGGYSAITMNGTRNVVIDNVRAHHFGYDGITVRDSWCPEGNFIPLLNLLINKSSFTYNARNNMTWAGGRGVTVNGSVFSYAGQARYVSNPGAGLDIEYEPAFGGWGYPNGLGRFNDCRFEYNMHFGMISDVNHYRVLDFTFNRCTFVGNFISMQNSSRRMTFDRCLFAGLVASHHSAPSNSPFVPNSNRTQFLNCFFTEEYNVPGLGRQSFQQTIDETGNGCPIPRGGHLFLLNVNGQGTILSNCRTWTNYTMKDASLNPGVGPGGFVIPIPRHNKIQVSNFRLFNHGLNGCDCDNELASLTNTNFIGWNGQFVAGIGILRNQLPPPAQNCSHYVGVSNSAFNSTTTIGATPGFFDQQVCCLWGGSPIVQKFENPGLNNPSRVWDLCESGHSTYPIIRSISTQTGCANGYRIKNPSQIKFDFNEVKIYPNPVNDNLYIEGLTKGELIRIYDLVGKQMIFRVASNNIDVIDMKSFSNGCYFINVKNSNFKFIKQ